MSSDITNGIPTETGGLPDLRPSQIHNMPQVVGNGLECLVGGDGERGLATDIRLGKWGSGVRMSGVSTQPGCRRYLQYCAKIVSLRISLLRIRQSYCCYCTSPYL